MITVRSSYGTPRGDIIYGSPLTCVHMYAECIDTAGNQKELYAEYMIRFEDLAAEKYGIDLKTLETLEDGPDEYRYIASHFNKAAFEKDAYSYLKKSIRQQAVEAGIDPEILQFA